MITNLEYDGLLSVKENEKLFHYKYQDINGNIGDTVK